MEQKEDGELCWYTLIPVGADISVLRNSIMDLIKDDPQAELTIPNNKRRLFVRTRLAWDYLRETLKDCIVGIAEVENREQEAKSSVQSQTTES